MIKDTYEISLWEDYLVDVELEDEVKKCYRERKIATIGSNTLEAKFRAINPCFVENINGTHTLTFTMYYTYVDEEDGQKKLNPFTNLMVNERKIKVYWKKKWYDLIIKNCEESSDGKSIIYTCEDLYVNELSKTGFNLEFDTELENNQGTAQELGAAVLEETDWKVIGPYDEPITLSDGQVIKSDVIQQTIEEPVYECEILKRFTAINDKTGEEVEINYDPTGQNDWHVLVYYSVVNNFEEPSSYFQFVYSPKDGYKTEENKQLVINGLYCSVDNCKWTKEQKPEGTEWTNGYVKIYETQNLSSRYRADRLVRKQKSIFDPLTETYVQVYTDADGNEIYGFQDTDYNSVNTISNLLINSEKFVNTDGWSGEKEINIQLYPELTKKTDLTKYDPLDLMRFEPNGVYRNQGLQNNTPFIPNGFAYGDEYILRFKGIKSLETVYNKIPVTKFDNNKVYYEFIPGKTYYVKKNGQYVPITEAQRKQGMQSGVTYYEEYREFEQNNEVFKYLNLDAEAVEDSYYKVNYTYLRDFGPYNYNQTYYTRDEEYIVTGDTTPVANKTYYTITSQYNKIYNPTEYYDYYLKLENGEYVTFTEEDFDKAIKAGTSFYVYDLKVIYAELKNLTSFSPNKTYYEIEYSDFVVIDYTHITESTPCYKRVVSSSSKTKWSTDAYASYNDFVLSTTNNNGVFVPTQDILPQRNKNYYYIYNEVFLPWEYRLEFDSDVIYYELQLLPIIYHLTFDTEKIEGKVYYELKNGFYVPTSDAELYEDGLYYEPMVDFGQTGESYIEETADEEFEQGYYSITFDTEPIKGKDYYVIDVDYIRVHDTDYLIDFYINDYFNGVRGEIQYFEPCVNWVQNGDWVETKIKCIEPADLSSIGKGLVQAYIATNDKNGYIESIQFFKFLEDAEGNRYEPNSLTSTGIVQEKFKYYNHSAADGLKNKEDIPWLWDSTKDTDLYTPVYNENFEKIRSISEKESNRFNLIQTIAETFECWARFVIDHDDRGNIIYDGDSPRKYVIFVNEIGQETGLGFVYGVDLKTIRRTIASDQIVTKTIVLSNTNEYGKDGFCTIARSSQNYSKDNFILNFDYYISQGLLDSGELNKDLYLSTGDSIGYYYNLNRLNTKYDNNTELITNLLTELTEKKALLTTYSNYVTAIENQLTFTQEEITSITGGDLNEAQRYIVDNPMDTKISTLLSTYTNLIALKGIYQVYTQDILEGVENINQKVDILRDKQKEILDEIKELNLAFYKKYSRFIQEGTWTSEDYMDDDLYYLDALGVSGTSSRPQISYDISVLRLSALEEFKNKIFNIGDVGFIQDTEFFGYVTINNLKTPYKERIVISEITSFFDSPEKDIIKVQNYKTQFEDLFQRITATTQSLQYAAGQYSRAASIVTNGGTIDAVTLQNSIQANTDLAYSAQNESYTMDSTGITVSDLMNPNNKTKITSGGIFITSDGGASWKSAVNSSGITTQYLTAGTLNVNNINIMNGDYPSFRWDKNGISAYYFNGDSGLDIGTFVRFDQFGIYGIQNNSDFVATTTDSIKQSASFGMTWDGFFMKNKYDSHYVEISNVDDIRVVDTTEGEVERVKIGKIDDDLYGIQISNKDGEAVMRTGSNGELWLEDTLTVGDGETSTVSIGYNPEETTAEGPTRGAHEVFNADNKLIIYSDGYIKATAGKIGNLDISKQPESSYSAVIEPKGSTILTDESESVVLEAHLYENGQKIDTTDMNLTYKWYCDGNLMSTTLSSIIVTGTELANSSNNNLYTCIITIQD